MEREGKEKMGLSVEFRDATEGDISIIKSLLVNSWVEHALNAPEMLSEETMKTTEADMVDEYYKEAINSSDSCVRIAEVDGEFAGFIKVDIKNIESFWRYPRVAFIEDLAVLKKFERKKIGHSLVDEAEEFANQKKIDQIQARVYTFNYPMQKVFRDKGYVVPHSMMVKTKK